MTLLALLFLAPTHAQAAEDICACRDTQQHLNWLESNGFDPGLRCVWSESSTATIPKKTVGPPTTSIVTLVYKDCVPACRYHRCTDGVNIPQRWDYDSEQREEVFGTITQPTTCFPIDKIVQFAVEVSAPIGASSAIHEVGGVVLVSQSSFAGITHIDTICPQCDRILDEFYAKTLANKGTYSEGS